MSKETVDTSVYEVRQYLYSRDVLKRSLQSLQQDVEKALSDLHKGFPAGDHTLGRQAVFQAIEHAALSTAYIRLIDVPDEVRIALQQGRVHPYGDGITEPDAEQQAVIDAHLKRQEENAQ